MSFLKDFFWADVTGQFPSTESQMCDLALISGKSRKTFYSSFGSLYSPRPDPYTESGLFFSFRILCFSTYFCSLTRERDHAGLGVRASQVRRWSPHTAHFHLPVLWGMWRALLSQPGSGTKCFSGPANPWAGIVLPG